MSPPDALSHDACRAEQRRNQILDAARECFSEQGFHGAGIALISRRAGMSAGHIYHYFENKEAIIAAIVAQDLERLLAVTEQLRTAPDVSQAIVARVSEGVRENLEPSTAGLKLEIVAEAARNPRIARIVREADRKRRDSLGATLRVLCPHGGTAPSGQDHDLIAEVFAAMFEGLQIRAIRNPDLPQETVIEVFQEIVRHLTHPPASGTQDATRT